VLGEHLRQLLGLHAASTTLCVLIVCSAPVVVAFEGLLCFGRTQLDGYKVALSARFVAGYVSTNQQRSGCAPLRIVVSLLHVYYY
jgi:hypothetical protein